MNGSPAKIRRMEWAALLFSFVFFGAAMYALSAYTSPLWPHRYGYDSAIFALLGKGVTQGLVLYRDLFDHKGPILFFIEAIGWLIGERTGIFVMQCLSGMLSIFFLFRIWTLFRPMKRFRDLCLWGLCLLAVSGFFFFTLERGNYSEEFSMPFITCSLLCLVKYARRTDADIRHPRRYALIHGICFAALAFIRLNNAVSICAGVLAVGLFLLSRRQYKQIFESFLFGCLGILCVSIPILLYFHANGALDEMLYATFTYNFLYGAAGQSVPSAHVAVCFLPLAASALILLPQFFAAPESSSSGFMRLLLLLLLLSNAVLLFFVNTYRHYFLIFVPVFMLFLCLPVPRWQTLLQILCAALCIAVFWNQNIRQFLDDRTANLVHGHSTIRHLMINDILDDIPQDERDSVVGYDIYTYIFLHGDIMPCHPYYSNQSWWSRSDPSIKETFLEWLDAEGALWLITDPAKENRDLLPILDRHYVLHDQNQHLALYRRISPPAQTP